jgi:hypothetical protein
MGLLFLTTSATMEQKAVEGTYEVRIQYWEWQSQDPVRFRDAPQNAKMIETIIFLENGRQNYAQVRTGPYKLTYAIVNAVDKEKKPFIRIVFRVSNNSSVRDERRKMSGSGQCYLDELGKKVFLGGGAHHPHGRKRYAQAVTCQVTKKKQPSLDEASDPQP